MLEILAGESLTGAQEEAENGAPQDEGRSIVLVLAGYSVMSMVINEEAEPGHSISLGVGV